eukprot:TRINITY_DN6914_c0_g1_i1.p1 TRINITY_DN6914_c0_g1~~TRINITY_DN6914_c0_g1_i1.p1  ORF type:complete len:456 (-),score=61.85 TRINITY_DN6914_c0_g1_i1:1175-2542(-)
MATDTDRVTRYIVYGIGAVASLGVCIAPLAWRKQALLKPQKHQDVEVYGHRRNVLDGHWVSFANDDGEKPHLSSSKSVSRPPKLVRSCPYCVGKEHLTGPALFTLEGTAGRWGVRVLNLQRDNSFESPIGDFSVKLQSLFVQVPASGHHELIVDSPFHDTILGLSSVRSAGLLVQALINRGQEMAKDRRVLSISYTKTHDPSNHALHPSTHVVSLPVVPEDVQNRMAESRRFFKLHHQCACCRMLQEELALITTATSRVLFRTQHFVALVPFAASVRYQIWIIPARHDCDFLACRDVEVSDLGAVIQRSLRLLHTTAHNPGFTLKIHSAPILDNLPKGSAASNNPTTVHPKLLNVSPADYYHWFVEISPTPSEGDDASGVQRMLPEVAAAALRDCEHCTPVTVVSLWQRCRTWVKTLFATTPSRGPNPALVSKQVKRVRKSVSRSPSPKPTPVRQ